MTTIGIVGPGRAGAGLAVALKGVGYRVRLHGRRSRTVPATIEFTCGGQPPWLEEVDALILAVPDDALDEVARQLARDGRVGSVPVVLHLSGVLDSSVLQPVADCGCAVGSLHPLQSLSDADTAAARFRGAAAAIEGDARAVRLAVELAAALDMTPLTVPSDAKPLYHAAAVFASNYLVVSAAMAQRLLERAGISSEAARAVLTPIIRGTVDNIVHNGAAGALTGPVTRGDRATIRKHLDTLPPDEAVLYRALARAALTVARLEEGERESVERELER